MKKTLIALGILGIVAGAFSLRHVEATVTGETLKHVYVLDESTTVFPYTFKILAATDMKVTLYNTTTKSGTVLTYGTDYTVAGAGQDSGTRTVTYAGAASYGDTYYLILQSNVAYTQPTDYVVGGSFSQETHEAALDRLAIQIKQLAERSNRSFKVDESQVDDIEFPADTAGYVYTDGTNFSLGTPTTTELDYNGDIEHGTDLSKSSTPTTGDLYFATDTDIFYRSLTNNTWTANTKQTLPSGASYTLHDSNGSPVMDVDANGNLSITSSLTVATGVIYADTIIPIADNLSIGKNLSVGQFQAVSGNPVGIFSGSPSAWIELDPATGDSWKMQATTTSDFKIHNIGDNKDRFAIDADGDLTVGGSVEISGDLTVSGKTSDYYHSRIKGWCDLTGTGTIAINDSFNVSSVTDNGTGDYTVTWDTDFTNTYYAVAALATSPQIEYSSKATGATRVITRNSGGSAADSQTVSIIAIGDQ